MERGTVRRLYEELGPALTAYARSLAGDEGEDAVQQVFTRLLSGDVAAPAEARPYLFRAVRNAALNSRRGMRAAIATEPVFEAPEGMEEEREALEQALSSLPEEQREIVVMRVWGGMTFEEAAAVLGVSLNTAASRFRYALEKLRGSMARFAEER